MTWKTLPERLRAYAKDQGGWNSIEETCEEAAARLEFLEHELHMLNASREVLRLERDDAKAKAEALRGSALPMPSLVHGRRWRHVKTGGEYTVIGECRLEATNEPAIVYRSAHGTVWARSKQEFFDGRFVPILDGGVP